VPSREVARNDLAFELPRCGASPFGDGGPDRMVEIGNAGGPLFRSRPSVSHVHRMNAAKDLSIREAIFLQRGPATSGLRARLPSGKTVAHFEIHLCQPTFWSRAALPFDQPGPDRGTIQETKPGRPTPSLKRTAEAFGTVVAFGG